MEVKYKGPGPAERLAARLKNSGGHDADHSAQHHPNRTITNIHHGGSQAAHGGAEPMNPLAPKDGDQ
jgi:hypothetical protein